MSPLPHPVNVSDGILLAIGQARNETATFAYLGYDLVNRDETLRPLTPAGLAINK